MKTKPIMVGAVAHAPRVVEIWEGFKEYFENEKCPIDFVLFSNYDAQTDAFLRGFIDIAWNTPLAFVKADLKYDGKLKLLATRDNDLDFKSKFVARKNTFKSLADLKGKTIAFGSQDSAQAALMPEYFLSEAGLQADKDYKALRFNSDVGKQGDTGTSEMEVLHALKTGAADAGTFGYFTWDELSRNEADLADFWTSPGFSHCVFNARPEADEKMCKHFVDTLLRMDFNNPRQRQLMEWEGLKKEWLLADRKGYADLFKAAKLLHYGESPAGVI